MKPNGMSPRNQQILRCYSQLPQKILSLHGNANLTEFVLHNLCHQECLNLPKAAYFVDNADFNTFKGIAGFDKVNELDNANLAWSDPVGFTNHMHECVFNRQVRDISLPSPKLSQKNNPAVLEDLADQLSISNPGFYSWNIKYDNKGLLIYEQVSDQDYVIDEEVLHGLCFLGFCPIF